MEEKKGSMTVREAGQKGGEKQRSHTATSSTRRSGTKAAKRRTKGRPESQRADREG